MTRTDTARIDDDALDDLERVFVGRLRGRVLEIGAGEGENFGSLHAEVTWTGLEPDAARRQELSERMRGWGHDHAPLASGAESIPLPDDSIDAILGTYVMCSVKDPEAVLAEVRRVLVPGGRVVFIEHVLAATVLGRAVQHAGTPVSRVCCHGCHWNRDTGRTLAVAGFDADDVRRVRVKVRPFGALPVLLFDGHAA